MQLRIMRRVPLGEVIQKVSRLEEKYGDDLENIPDLFTDGQLGPEAFEDYVEWLGMIHALRAYGEGEDFDYYTEDMVKFERKEFRKLTPCRIELLEQLSRHRVDSINDFASKIKRDVKNVYYDLKTLEALGFVRLHKESRNIIPELIVQEITILLW